MGEMNTRKEFKSEDHDGMGKRKKTSHKTSYRPVFNATNDHIEWAKWTWNPYTGCLHECKYCYARDIAHRFYPEKFEPTFRPGRLAAPFNTKIPERRKDEPGIHNVFVCSMADVFGDWVAQEHIDQILDVVRATPQWNYLFLTKNPKRLIQNWPDNSWVGATVDIQARVKPTEQAFKQIQSPVKFLSCEPLLEALTFTNLDVFDWVILGARSRSSRLAEFQPKWQWVENIMLQARQAGCSVYFKPNLKVAPKEYPVNENRTSEGRHTGQYTGGDKANIHREEVVAWI